MTPSRVELTGQRRYVGRFAPSPTGALHFGSLVAAVGSYLEARSRGGAWHLRIEDVDEPRCSVAAADDILRTLDAFGFEWDGPVVWQSQRQSAYAAALDMLRESGQVFPCACTRREMADTSLGIDGSVLYPGTCRAGLAPGRPARAWRLRVAAGSICFEDAVQGVVESDLVADVGDFVLRRADGLFAYQLAVVVDDAECGITHIVRGADLLHSTARQIFLQRCLGLPTPEYAHLPVAVNSAGEKLSKQTLAKPLDRTHPTNALIDALRFLGQPIPGAQESHSLTDVWQWAIPRWSLANVPRRGSLPYNDPTLVVEK